MYIIPKIFINDNQYIGNVPETAWQSHIGAYCPAVKYLKDRKGQNLTIEEIIHYQKIVATLGQTAKIVGQIGDLPLWMFQ